MNAIYESIKAFFDFVIRQVTYIGFADVIDILLLSFFLFYLYKFIKDRRAGKLAVGIVIMSALLIIADIFNMHAMKYILQNFFQVGMILLIIVFQPELRSALEKMGGRSFIGLKNIGSDLKNSEYNETVLNSICEAACDLAKDKTGALIAIERSTKLGDFISSGVVINADVNAALIKNIFFNKAPLHDGAMIIRDARVYAAGCFLPLSTKDDITKNLGTRHRAAIGLSEVSDAVVIVASEETGTISVAIDGKLKRNYTYSTLKKELTARLDTLSGVTKLNVTKNVADKLRKNSKSKKSNKN